MQSIFISCKILSIIIKIYNDCNKLFFSPKIFSKLFSSAEFKLFNISSYISSLVVKKNKNSKISFFLSHLLNKLNKFSTKVLSFPNLYLGRVDISVRGAGYGSFFERKSSLTPIAFKLSQTVSSRLDLNASK